jgi:hypothetical protein
VSGFGYCGIRFYSNWDIAVKAGYKDVIIENCKVHDCRENGIVSFAYDNQNTNFYHHKNFNIRNTEVYNITGYSSPTHKGSGIVLSQIDSSLIEKCVAYNTGKANTACGGPGGIWVYAANRITIQYCESHHNSAGSGAGCDGLGFDLDGGVTNSVIQYCYSHDNDGAGYLLGNFDGARPWGNNTVRYCVSANDALTNNSAVTLFTAPNTQWNGLKFYNNTIVVNPSAKNTYPDFGAFQMTNYGSNMSGVECYNNIFQTADGLPFVSVPLAFTVQNPKFNGNLYYTNGSKTLWKWGSQTANSLDEFRNLSVNCENLSGTKTGYFIDPMLKDVGIAPANLFPQPNNILKQFAPMPGSPAIDKGLNLNVNFSINTGNRDFAGSSIPGNSLFDIGAFEASASNSIEAADNKAFNLFPNPLNGEELTLQMINNEIVSQFQLYSITGNLLFHKICESSLNSNELNIRLGKIQPGIYLVRIETTAGKKYSQILVGQ